MRDLIARIEAATGPDRELDVAIAQAIGWRHVAGQAWLRPEDAAHAKKSRRGALNYERHSVPTYTASLDAALTLYVKRPVVIPSCPRLACVEALTERMEAEDA
jgi:hypothetical protein